MTPALDHQRSQAADFQIDGFDTGASNGVRFIAPNISSVMDPDGGDHTQYSHSTSIRTTSELVPSCAFREHE